MKRTFSWLREPAVILMILLLISSALVTGAGLLIKQSIGRGNALVENTMAIAVPFLLLRGEIGWDMAESLEGEAPLPPAEESLPQLPFGPEKYLSPEGSSVPAAPEVKYHQVEEDYFDGALFIGDSRTEGLKLYGRLGQADYFASAGMSVFNLFEKSVSDQRFQEQTLSALLAERSYERIYLSLGINEVGYPPESLERKFAQVIAQLRALQPQAKLILLENLAVTEEKARANESLSLENIRRLNALIVSHADNEMIFSLDPNRLLSGEDGYLRPEVTGDGVHPYAKEYQNFAIWLKEYGLD